MADKPILFSGPMVRALLEGRKTQTRRVIKLNGRPPEYCGPRGCMDDPTCWGWDDPDHGDWVTLEKERGQRLGWRDLRVSYAPGDLLWVREAWNIAFASDLTPGEAIERTAEECATSNRGFACACGDGVVYRATGAQQHPDHGKARWRPSIHMPRWASRLTLIVTDVRVQRLQEISHDDAVAEGMGIFPHSMSAQKRFREVWNSRTTTPEVTALVSASTALRDQIASWRDGGPVTGPDESRALFEALDDALKNMEAANE